MKSPFRRFATIASLGAALSALAAGSAQAAVPTTTMPATSVTASSALLNGTVETGGAPVQYQFEYGKSTSYGQTTTAALILAGHGTVSVSTKATGLKPGTKYHFRLDTQTGDGTNSYYPLVITFGQDATFTTKKVGRVSIGSTKLSVHKNIVSISLKCASSQTCKGKLTLTARIKIGKKLENLTFTSKSFAIPAGHKLTLKAKLSKTALKLLKKAHGHRLKVKLTVKFSTGQPRLTKTVTLILK